MELNQRSSLSRPSSGCPLRLARWIGPGCLGLFLFSATLGQEAASPDSPFPTIEDLLEKVRENLHSDRFLLRRYTYNDSQKVIELNKKGEPQKTKVRSYEVFPSTVEELIYRRLVSKDGKPVKEKELRKQDKKYNKRVQKFVKKARKRGLQADSEYEAGEAEALREEQAVIDEVLRLYQFEIQGRKLLEEHPTLVVSFTPRPGFKSKIKDTKILQKIQGRVWVSEQDYHPVKVEAETLKSLKFGWGIVAKLNTGAHMVFQRRKVNDEVWLPARASFQGSGRLLLFKGFRFQATSLYSDYKKFTVASKISFTPAGQPAPAAVQ